MKLKTFMQREQLSPRKMARKLGCTHQAVRHWLKHRRMPRPSTLALIEAATCGKVNAESFK